jgi:hypothetical protein
MPLGAVWTMEGGTQPFDPASFETQPTPDNHTADLRCTGRRQDNSPSGMRVRDRSAAACSLWCTGCRRR